MRTRVQTADFSNRMQRYEKYLIYAREIVLNCTKSVTLQFGAGLARYLYFEDKPVYLRAKKSVQPVKMEGKAMKAKRWLVLAAGAMLVMNVSAREVRKCAACKGKPIRMEQQFVRCERCGKMIDLRKEARFREFERREAFKREAFRREEFRRGDFRKGDFRKAEFKKSHKRHGRR